MIHQLTVELPDEVYEHVTEMASKAHLTPEERVIERLLAITPRGKFPTPAELAEARPRLLRYAGAVSVPDPTNADNEQIDRDLAEEYASTHEPR